MGTTSGIAPTSLVIGARVKATTLMNAPPGGITPPADHFRWLSATQATEEMVIQVPAILAHEETDIPVLTLEETHDPRSEEHTSELQSLTNLVCRLLLEKKKKKKKKKKKRKKNKKKKKKEAQLPTHQ